MKIDLYKYLITKQDMNHNILINSLSMSECISITDVIEHSEIPWKYVFLSMNPNITWAEINSHPEISWDFDNIIYNNMSCPLESKKYRILYNEVIREINYL